MSLRPAMLLFLLATTGAAASDLPDGFVYLRDVAPSVVQDIRYAGSHNFVGRPIDGYAAGECILTAEAATRLAGVQDKLVAGGFTLIVWDCYRPARAVADVRNELSCQLAGQLGPDFTVAPCSMERRDGAAYDFCEPLLAGLLRQPGWNAGEVTIALQFLLPGRHAGPGGDVAEICREAEAAGGGKLRTAMTALVAEHPLLVDILADRWQAALR